ncbi:MAG: rRNA pseudouridine synthase [Flavobacteriales bacterium]|nr:rRNA pseudouridine synthase [Flavobacteriales bacterium]
MKRTPKKVDFNKPEKKPSVRKPKPDRKKEKYAKAGPLERKYVGKGKKKPREIERASVLPRLNQYIAKAGVCSRREADELIATGQIKLNGKVVHEMGVRVQHDDRVEYEGRILRGEEAKYLLLNKPKGYLSTASDDRGRKTVMDIVGKACKERIYPVGRLDRETTGLLLFTNDGDLAKKLTHPSGNVEKIYHVFLDRPMEEEDMETAVGGIELEDGFIKPDAIDYAADTPDGTQVGVQLHSGRNRIVRRMFEHFKYEVKKLDRVVFANLTKKDLPRGKWRFLRDKEVSMLQQISGKTKDKTLNK